MTALLTIGRVMTGLFFILAGINKIIGFDDVAEVMRDAGLEPALLLLPLTILLEIGAGAIVLVGRGGRLVSAAALALALFTLATNLVFHRFWELNGVMQQLELSLFFKNLVVIGALFMVAGLTHPRRASS